MTAGFLTVESERFRLVFWPECGGRLLSALVEGEELLWRSPDFLDKDGNLTRPKPSWRPIDGTMGSWSNVGGSKTWPAPQGWSGEGEWPGPPDALLDAGEWAAEVIGGEAATVVTMTSPLDPRSGLQVTRSFVVPAYGLGFRQTNTFRNVSTKPVRWSIWEVCQVDTASCLGGGELEVEVGGDSEPTVMIEAFGRMPLGWMRDSVRVLPITDVVGKLGFSDATGSVGLTRPDGAAIHLGFRPEPGADYPDGGARVELWMQCPIPDPLPEFGDLHPRERYVELEVLGPLRTLQPGDSMELTLDWQLTPGPRHPSRPADGIRGGSGGAEGSAEGLQPWQ